MKIVVASGNAGKIRELQSLVSAQRFNLIAQHELGVSEIAETGLTFVENALIKARHACQETGLAAIADDSGLVVAALEGAPGIYSARYAGPQQDSQANIAKLLAEMSEQPEINRQAAFYCVLVFLLHEKDPVPIICQGVWQGSLLKAPQGNNGFGYDPIFAVPGENKSAAELSLEMKNHLSHRGKALRLLAAQLEEKLKLY